VKGLYEKAKQGMIKNFTGIDDVYEEPDDPEIVLETNKMGVDEGVRTIVSYLEGKGCITQIG
jgi:adenylylsulfate kinase